MVGSATLGVEVLGVGVVVSGQPVWYLHLLYAPRPYGWDALVIGDVINSKQPNTNKNNENFLKNLSITFILYRTP
jgi:hypothetical protein